MGRSDVKLVTVGPVSHVRYLTHGESSSIVIVVMSTYMIRNPLSRSGRVGKGDLSPGVPMRVRRRGVIAHGPGRASTLAQRLLALQEHSCPVKLLSETKVLPPQSGTVPYWNPSAFGATSWAPRTFCWSRNSRVP